MNAIKINPLIRGKSFGNIVEEVLGSSISGLTGENFEVTSPAVNISESDEAYRLEVAAPGLVKTDFSISIENDQLIIATTDKSASDTKENKWAKKEFDFSHFRRVFHLSETVDKDTISASYENGALNIFILKRQEIRGKEVQEIKIK
ncbi:MAG: Hsp20/alpha crystallin family protein [Saprospiraceae bacterium]|nr:Hsp20/alpha crystallin family protein [Saprospiraceae bacterium]